MLGEKDENPFVEVSVVRCETKRVATLLKTENTCVMVDCGLPSNEAVNKADFPLVALSPTALRYIYLTDATLEAAGGFPLLVEHLQLQAPALLQKLEVFATLPVKRLLKLVLFEHYQFINNHRRQVCKAFFELLAFAVALIKPLSFDQPIVRELGDTLVLETTLLSTGLSVGAAAVCVSVRASGTVLRKPFSAVFCSDLAVAQTRLNSPSGLLTRLLARPTALFVGGAPLEIPSFERTFAESQLTAELVRALGAGGSVLLPVDLGGRLVETLLFLASVLRKKTLPGRPKVFVLSELAQLYVRTNAALLEWAGDQAQQFFDTTGTNPFELRECVFVDSWERLRKQLTTNSVVLATGESLLDAQAEDAFREFAARKENAVVFLGRSARSEYVLRCAANKEAAEWTEHMKVAQQERGEDSADEEETLFAEEDLPKASSQTNSCRALYENLRKSFGLGAFAQVETECVVNATDESVSFPNCLLDGPADDYGRLDSVWTNALHKQASRSAVGPHKEKSERLGEDRERFLPVKKRVKIRAAVSGIPFFRGVGLREFRMVVHTLAPENVFVVDTLSIPEELSTLVLLDSPQTFEVHSENKRRVSVEETVLVSDGALVVDNKLSKNGNTKIPRLFFRLTLRGTLQCYCLLEYTESLPFHTRLLGEVSLVRLKNQFGEHNITTVVEHKKVLLDENNFVEKTAENELFVCFDNTDFGKAVRTWLAKGVRSIN